MELKFIQIQAVTASNGQLIIYGLDSLGKVWHKQHGDSDWQKMSMTFNHLKENCHAW